MIRVGGENGMLSVPVADGVARLPAGKYRLTHWELRQKDKAGSSWRLVAALPGTGAVFEAGGDKPVALNVGGAVVTTISGSKSGNTHSFSVPRFSGRGGEWVTTTRNGRDAPLPTLRIRNADGSYDRQFNFRYG